MRAFCPNCGTPNDGLPGGRITCSACTASFEVPREEFGAPPPSSQPAVQAPPLSWTQPPAQQPVATPAPAQIPPELRAPPIMPQGYVGPPPTGFGAGLANSGGTTNPLAIVSLVAGLLCCSPVALITGFLGYQQITQSNGAQKGQGLAIAGMVLGAIGILFGLCSVFSRAVH